MKILYILVLFLFASFVSCRSKPEKNAKTDEIRKNYELMADDDGILVEKFDSTVVDENRYNHNNTIYKVGNSFKYKFEHITPNKETKFFKVNEDDKSWEFVDEKDADSTTIKSVVIEVADGNPMSKYISDYNQTALVYKLKKGNEYSMSGAIENEGNVWIHPPREKYFRILELNPFPILKPRIKLEPLGLGV